MGEVIDLGNRTLVTEWRFSMDFYQDRKEQWSADVTGYYDDDVELSERLRQIADGLDAISFMAKQKAELINESPDGTIVATMNVYRSSKVSVRINYNVIMTKEQEAWLAERFEDAKEAIPER